MFEMSCIFILKNRFNQSDLRSVAMSFWLGLIFAFIAQKLLTYKNRSSDLKTLSKQMTGYLLLVLWNYLFTLSAVKLLSNTFPVMITRTLVILLVTIWNYQIYRHLFKNENKEKSAITY
jgi:putative flippase GtrA